MAKKYASPIERLMANTRIRDDLPPYEGEFCWDWTGRVYRNRSGMTYGRINYREGGKHCSTSAHRWVVAHVKGRRVRGKVIQHLCNRPLCCNPAHLVGGTQTANMKQMVKDGRHGNQHKRGIQDHAQEAHT